MNGRHFYREVGQASVPLATRRAVAGALSFARIDLELIACPPPRWFERSTALPSFAEQLAGLDWFTSEQRIDGQAGRGKLWLRADLSAARAAEVALHEACHVFQQQLVGVAASDPEYDLRERQARGYSDGLRHVAQVIAGAY